MSKVINKDGKWVVVDDEGNVGSTPFTERSAAESFMHLRDGVLNPPAKAAAPTPAAYGPPAPGAQRPEPTQFYGPAPNVEQYGPPTPMTGPRPWRPADRSETEIYRVGSDIRTRGDQEKPGWLSKVKMTTEQWRALLAGLGVQNMPSTPNPNHPEEF